MCKIENGIVLDVGSHIGVFSLQVAELKRKKKLNNLNIYAFEPSSQSYKNLTKNISINRLQNFINTENYALSNRNIESWIEKNPSNSGGNKININKNIKTEDLEKIVCKKLDDHDFDNQSIQFMKIDTEGHEIDVIEGGIKLIQKYKPSMFIEVSEELYIKQKKTFLATFENLVKLYKKFYIEKINYSHSLENVTAAEVVSKIKEKKTFNMLITN